MMGEQKSERELFNYAVNLEKRVRSDHPLRRVAATIDFKFVREEEAEAKGVRQKRKGSEWGCPDLTDSGHRVKTQRSPHENTVIEAGSRSREIHQRVQATSAGVMASQWPQCRQGGGGAGHPRAVALPLGEDRASACRFIAWPKAVPQHGRTGGGDPALAR